MSSVPLPIHGRGSSGDPPNRFEPVIFEPDADYLEHEPQEGRPETQYFHDRTQSILAYNDSPDVGFDVGINPYRGCEHGCIYCYARPYHEYLGLSCGLDFETKIFVKTNADELLRKELLKPGWQPQTIGLSGVTDCYQPIERKLKVTRSCLAVLAEFGNPASVITKNHLVTRDIDLLSQLARKNAVRVMISLTTLDHDLSMKMEPRASAPSQRLRAIEQLSEAGIPVGVMTAPIIPAVTDHEVPALLAAAAKAGAIGAGFTVLRLPYQLKEIFDTWLTQHFPDRKDKVLNRIREMRGGKLNTSEFGKRMRGEGIFAEQIKAMFKLARKRAGLDQPLPPLSTDCFHRPGEQMNLFGHR